MSIRVRFIAWVVCVVLQLIGLPVWMILAARADAAPAVNAVGALTSTLLAVAVFALIVTTPPGAIRLKPARSMIAIVSGSAWLFVFQVATLDRNGPAIVGSALSVFGIAMIVLVLQRVRSTPWLATCLVWNPAFIGPLAIPPVIAGVLLPVLAAGLFLVSQRLRPRKLTP